MSDAMTASAPIADAAPALKLRLVGEADAAVCDGDFCELPAHREQAVMNRRVDSDTV